RAFSALAGSAVLALLLLRRPVSGSTHSSFRKERSFWFKTYTVMRLSGMVTSRIRPRVRQRLPAGPVATHPASLVSPPLASAPRLLRLLLPWPSPRAEGYFFGGRLGQVIDLDAEGLRQRQGGGQGRLALPVLQLGHPVVMQAGALG